MIDRSLATVSLLPAASNQSPFNVGGEWGWRAVTARRSVVSLLCVAERSRGGLWVVLDGFWYLVFGIWFLVFDIWLLVFDI